MNAQKQYLCEIAAKAGYYITPDEFKLIDRDPPDKYTDTDLIQVLSVKYGEPVEKVLKRFEKHVNLIKPTDESPRKQRIHLLDNILGIFTVSLLIFILYGFLFHDNDKRYFEGIVLDKKVQNKEHFIKMETPDRKEVWNRVSGEFYDQVEKNDEIYLKRE